MKYVLGFAFSTDLSQVLLIVKERPAWQKDLANGIGGKILANESSMQAMNRKAMDEAMLQADWVPFMSMEGWDSEDEELTPWHVDCFTCRTEKIHSTVSNTDEGLVIWDSNRLPSNIVPHVEMSISMAKLAFSDSFYATLSFSDSFGAAT